MTVFGIMKEATLWRKTASWAASEGLLGNEAWNALALSFVMLQLEILISCIAGPNFQFRYQRKAGAWDDDQLFEVLKLKCGGFHLDVTEVVPVGGGVDEKVELISIKMT